MLHTKISDHNIIYWKKTGLLHTKISNHNIIYWKKTGLLHTKISKHNIIYSFIETQKIVVSATKNHLRGCFHSMRFKFGNNNYPRRIRRRSNLGHIFWGENKCVLWAGKHGKFYKVTDCLFLMKLFQVHMSYRMTKYNFLHNLAQRQENFGKVVSVILYIHEYCTVGV